jgi:hypothetical protein
MKKWYAVAALALLTGCASGPRTIPDGKWNMVIDRSRTTPVTLYVSEVDIPCRLVDAGRDELTIERDGKRETIPVDAITRVLVPYQGNKSKSRWIGGGTGFVLGAGLGFVLGNAASDESGAKVIAHPFSLLSILGGTAAGLIVSNNFTRDEAYVMNRDPLRYTLDIEVGDAITPLELNSFNLFDDIKIAEGEKILQVQIFQLGGDRFLLLYDVATNTIEGYAVRWTVVNSAYLAQQKSKIRS